MLNLFRNEISLQVIFLKIQIDKNKLKLNEIYEKSLVPVIYDCQNKLEKISESKTILESLGGSLQD